MAVAAEPTRANYIEKNRSNNQTRDVQLRQSCFGKSRIYKPYSLRCERSRQTKWNLKTTSGKSIRADILPKAKFEIVIDEEYVKKSYGHNSKNCMHRHNQRRKNLRLHNRWCDPNKNGRERHRRYLSARVLRFSLFSTFESFKKTIFSLKKGAIQNKKVKKS